MKNDFIRFLITLFLPPSLGAICFLAVPVAKLLFDQDSAGIHFHEIPPFFLLFAGYGFIFTTIPAILYFLALEFFRTRYADLAPSILKYSLFGTSLGLFCGVSIGLMFNNQALQAFIPIGCIVGFTNAWIIFPIKRA